MRTAKGERDRVRLPYVSRRSKAAWSCARRADADGRMLLPVMIAELPLRTAVFIATEAWTWPADARATAAGAPMEVLDTKFSDDLNES